MPGLASYEELLDATPGATGVVQHYVCVTMCLSIDAASISYIKTGEQNETEGFFRWKRYMAMLYGSLV